MRTALQQIILGSLMILSVLSANQNCFDYIVTTYQGEVYNDLGFTTYLQLKANSKCDVEIYTGIARFVYESGMKVQMYSYNSLEQPVYLEDVTNGEMLYWYYPNGKAPTRLFTVINPTGYSTWFRVTIQKTSSIKGKNAVNLLNNIFLLSFFVLGLIFY